jgi:S1-C subfamily serine protease
MKNQKGFISITILIAIIAGVLVVSGGTYLGIKKYEQYQKNKLAQEQEKITLTNAQGKALEEAQSEIEKLKSDNELTKQEQQGLEKQIQQKNISSGSSSDNSYSKIPFGAVAKLGCLENPNDLLDISKHMFGSGVFIDSKHGWVLTNKHVVNGNDKTTCEVMVRDPKNSQKQIAFHAKVIAQMVDMDAAILEVEYLAYDSSTDTTANFRPVPKGYAFPEKTESCKDSDIKLGAKLAVVGYPLVGGDTITVTEGIVSGFDGEDYIKTSAKIEGGNSGGGAFLIPSGCWIGIPSASAVGEIESLGRILRWKA